MNEFTKISDYILYLRQKCNLAVSIHPCETDTFIINTPLNKFNIHDNPYCVCVKSNKAACAYCVEKQHDVLDKVKECGAFCGTCHAGVKEFVYPICGNDCVVGFLSVSGYKSDSTQQIVRTAERFNIDHSILKSAYDSLKSDVPDKKYVDTLIYPLLNMIELAYLKREGDVSQKNSFYDSVAAYIKRNYTLNLTADDICKHFSCSRSHLSHTFNALSGMTIREFINTLRTDSAKVMLRSSDLTIAEIAISLGYSNANYFSDVFKHIVGISPQKFKAKRN